MVRSKELLREMVGIIVPEHSADNKVILFYLNFICFKCRGLYVVHRWDNFLTAYTCKMQFLLDFFLN